MKPTLKTLLVEALLVSALSACTPIERAQWLHAASDVGTICGLGAALKLAEIEASMFSDETWAKQRPVLEAAGAGAAVCIVQVAVADLMTRQIKTADKGVDYGPAIGRGLDYLREVGLAVPAR